MATDLVTPSKHTYELDDSRKDAETSLPIHSPPVLINVCLPGQGHSRMGEFSSETYDSTAFSFPGTTTPLTAPRCEARSRRRAHPSLLPPPGIGAASGVVVKPWPAESCFRTIHIQSCLKLFFSFTSFLGPLRTTVASPPGSWKGVQKLPKSFQKLPESFQNYPRIPFFKTERF